MKIKSLSIIFFLIQLSIQQAFSCSTFCLKDSNNIVFGRSYDYVIGYGYVMTNLRNIKKTRYLPYDETPTTWTSKFGSITFNQYGKEYPMGGMNETGLVVEVMWLPDTQYPNPDQRSAIDELGWVQYQLDNSASIKDVIENDKKIRISNKTLGKIHFLVTDNSGKSLIVEYLNGITNFYYDDKLPLPCLTNDSYSKSLAFIKNNRGFGGEAPIDYQNHSVGNSLNRFAIIADMLNKYKPEENISVIDYSFDILNKVKDEKESQFQIVYDIKHKKIYFCSLQSQNIKSVDFEKFDFDCSSKVMMIDINNSYEGNISNRFISYNAKTNYELVKKAYPESGFNLPENFIKALTDWTNVLRCDENK